MSSRLRQTLCFSATMLLLASLLAAEEEFKPYQSLLPSESTSPAGYLIVQVPGTRKAPAGWEMQWFISTYTQKGFRLPLGTIEDKGTVGAEGKLAFKVPVGQVQVEITRKSEKWSTGRTVVYLVDEGRYQCELPESVFVAKTVVTIPKDAVKIVNINYQNPQVFVDTKEKDKKTSVFTWQNFSLLVADGSRADLPTGEPETYHLVKYGSLDEINQARLVQALKDDKHYVAAIALLHTKKPAADLILAALKDGSLKLSGPVALILAKAKDTNAVPALIETLRKGSEEARYLAAWALGELGAVEAVEPLVQALAEKSLMLRSNAAFALAKIKDPRAVEGLAKAAKDKQCLQGFSVVLARPELYLTFFIDRQYKNVGIEFPLPSNCIQDTALYAMGQIRGEQACDYLLEFLKASDAEAQRRAIFPLSNCSDPKVVDALIPKLKSSDESTRWMTVHALSRLGAQKAEAGLSELATSDPSAMVKEAASGALKKIKEGNQPKPISKKE
jgi:HEAT repeat protein